MFKAFISIILLTWAAQVSAETFQFTNVTRYISSSGTSFELVRESENVFRGTVLICEGGCDKFPLRAVLTNNILTVSYLDQVEKFKVSNFRLYPLTQGFTTAVMFLCSGKRTTVNNYQCYNHAESKLKYSWN